MTKQQCIHAELARADERSPWYCVNPDCGFTLWPPDEPLQEPGPQQDGLTNPSGPRLAWNDDPNNLALNDRSPQKSTGEG